MVETLERSATTAGTPTPPVYIARRQTRPELVVLMGPTRALVEAEADREARIVESNRRIAQRPPIDLGSGLI